MSDDAEQQVAEMIEKFAPPMQEMIRGCRGVLHDRFPHAVQLVYDNYNFFVIGFGPTDRPSEAVFSLACYRNGVNLCFLQRGPELPDPTGLLRGNGTTVRNVRLHDPADLRAAEVDSLIEAALELARVPITASTSPSVLVKSVSARQRPRR